MQNLFRKYLDNQCSPDEVKQLLSHFNAQENEGLLKSLIREGLNTDHSTLDNADNRWGQTIEETYHRIKKQIDAEKVKVLPFFKKTWFRIAASVVIIFSALTWFFFQGQQRKEVAEVKNEKKFENDIEPGGDKAILTLADGTKIILDSTKNGTIAQQGAANVVKTDEGQLAYSPSIGGGLEGPLYNTISTPRGGQYRLVLPDGSMVWLNAQSSIRFPAMFTGTERRVEIKGEVYFEVAKNKAMPFRVKANDMEVEVLGTHFNIMAYDDEALMKTTLLEGAVKVSSKTKSVFLQPEQQAKFAAGSNDLKITSDVDVDEETAWKTGWFRFNDADISTVMRQLSRWYDVEVSYSGSLASVRFTGKISRNISLLKVLKILELSDVHFKIEGKKIIVTS
jgi:transmembrane sensor